MHREMVDAAEKRKREQRGRVAAKKGVKLPKFSIGDFVLAAMATGRRGTKLSLLWRGPKRIVAAHNDYTFDVQDLVPPYAVSIKHAARLQLYREAARRSLEELAEQAIHGEGGHLVETLLDCRLSPDTHKWPIKVKWYGLDELDTSWEPADAIKQDLPVIYQAFVDVKPDDRDRAQMPIALTELERHPATPRPLHLPRQRRRPTAAAVDD
ncbi:hypothetical protein PINS_up016444 [Pythium insidiosum]|nr:hypothetical protein PINS_up016444 [Pythium insidiosum]